MPSSTEQKRRSILDVKFELLVDRVPYKDKPKPADAEIGAIRNRLARKNARVSIDIETLERGIKGGHTLMPGVCVGGTKVEHWVSQQLWFLDFDNDDEVLARGLQVLDPDVALDRAYSFGLEPLFLYFSHRATVEPWNPRYRMVFGVEEPVTDKANAEFIGTSLLKVFPEADPSSCQLNRMFFCPGREVWPCWR